MTKSQQGYPTDLNDTEWAQIAPYLPKASRMGAPRKHGWRVILNAMFYVVKNGCVWRALPHDFPCWQTVSHYFRLFGRTGVWEQINTMIREAVRVKIGKVPQASAMIADSQSATSAEGGESRWFDGGRRYLLVDTLGLVVLAKVTAASVQDVHAGKQLFSALAQRPALLTRLNKIFNARVGGHEMWGAIRGAEMGDSTVETRTIAQTLQAIDLLTHENDLLEMFCDCIVKNKSIGIYDDAYKSVELATGKKFIR